MPTAAPRPCPTPRCPEIVTAARPCPRHPRLGWGSSGRPGSTRQWRVVRLQVLERAGWLCERCRRQLAAEVHHVIPLRQGGTHDPATLEALCHACHAAETGRARWGRKG